MTMPIVRPQGSNVLLVGYFFFPSPRSTSYERNSRVSFIQVLCDLKMKVLVPFLSELESKDTGGIQSHHALFYPNAPDNNVKIAISLEIVQTSGRIHLII